MRAAAAVQPNQASLVAMLVCLASSGVGGQEPAPLTTRAQSLVEEITGLERRVEEWEERAKRAESEVARFKKENEALR